MKKIELLAPAGDLNRLKTAVLYGADAVYIGGKQFSLRSRASNFDLDDIKEAVKFAHRHGSRVHVTVNMIPHEEDFDDLDEYLITLDKIGVDAIIVASLTILKRAKQLTNLEVHISTQYSITNSKTITFWQSLGADRTVLARENQLFELEALMKQTNMPIEVFVHGGMCVNYSGRCTLSNYMTGRDANRGGCAQSCRWKYELVDNHNNRLSDSKVPFSMSSKDLNAIDYLDDLIRLGVASLKIEGRMKTEYYIATIVGAYRRAIDDLYAGKDAKKVLSLAKKELLNAENRQTFGGFYDGLPRASGHLYGVNGAGVNQAFVGTVLDYDEHTQRATIEVRNHFSEENKLEFFSPFRNAQSFYPKEMIDSQGESTKRFYKPMEVVSFKVNHPLQKGDFLRKAIGS